MGAFIATNVNANTPVKTITVTPTLEAQQLFFDGRIEAVKAATVSAQTAGRIIKLNYDINDLVPEGAPLLEITSKEQGAGFASAEAELARAKAKNIESQAQFLRYQALFPKGAISKGAMDEATANASSSLQAVSAAKAALIKARETLNYTIVSAPFSGRVTERFVELGETVAVGQPLLSGYDTSEMRAVFQLPQQHKNLISPLNSSDKQVSNLKVKLDGDTYLPKQSVTAFEFINQNNHSFQARVYLSQSEHNVIPGQWVKIIIDSNVEPSLYIPVTAITKRGQLSGVYRQVNDQTLFTQIRTGQQQTDQVEVLAGLQSGDVILEDALAFLINQNVNKQEQ
ncbi:efflux RND transporter periplasmic adaptor subunit [Shewanella donghaensis]|uniref:efflux RND transporter periplasmic adaptor subunit n=1 Tax=Shewanella donghaensis TaxID=238836 RepID=UPI0011822513|nr:efflux RND transporter periplasmic adaptor subunit [Shewanella donghaensis]